MRIRHRREESHESSHGIDLAPMLDFVTNLLIFFIITAVFVKESALQVSRPTDVQNQNEKNDTESIQIQIASNGDIYIDNRVVDIRAVRANVERMSAINPKAGVIVMANELAPSGVMVEVVDQVHLGGIYNIMFTTST